MSTPVVVGSIRGGVTEVFAPGDRVTYAVKAGQTVHGGKLVELTGNYEVQEAAADSAKVIGIALYDGVGNNGESVTVAAEGVWMLLVTDAGGIAAGDRVQAAAAGACQNGGTVANSVGKALAAAANAAYVPVQLSIL